MPGMRTELQGIVRKTAEYVGVQGDACRAGRRLDGRRARAQLWLKRPSTPVHAAPGRERNHVRSACHCVLAASHRCCTLSG